MGDSQGTWTRNEKLVFAGIVVAVLIAIVTWLVNQSNTIIQATNGGTTNVHKGTGDIHANVTNNHHQYDEEKLIDLAHKLAQKIESKMPKQSRNWNKRLLH